MAHSQIVIQDVRKGADYTYAAYQDRRARSVAALPIRIDKRTAGCMLVLCAQPNFFTPGRLSIIEQYCHLLVITLDSTEFYAREMLEMRVMPPMSVQQTYLAQFRQRVSILVKQARHYGLGKELSDFEREVRQSIEDELVEKALPERQENGSACVD
jgi:GAF domain-containing protein